MDIEVGSAIQTGGRATGYGLAALAAVKLIMFLFEWCGRRWDAHVKRMGEREALADKSIGARLRHLESQQARDATLIAGLYRAIGILTARLAPADPALVEVRDIIAAALHADPGPTPQDMENMLDKLRGES
jgi:hypothetical protein